MFLEHNNYNAMKFVNRIEEAKRLKQVLNVGKSTFTVLYGRRRLGKSTLINRLLSERDVYYLADQTDATLQREVLSKMIAVIIPGFDKVIYPSWSVFFDTLNDRTSQKFTLCIDEFPYLVGSSPDLPSILQNKIDSKQLKFNLVVCGSSQQLMYGLVLDAASPLYGRADAILKIAPIKVTYLQEALGVTALDAVEEYAVWGGVPRYWELREGYTNLREAIESNILSVNGTLYEEPLKLFKIAPILSNLDNHFSHYVGDYWEKLCRETVSGNEIDGITYGIARRWWGNISREERIELDIVAESLDKKYLLVGECKWTNKENSNRLLAELMEKAKRLPFAENHTIIPKLFLKNRPEGTMENVLLPDYIMKYQ